MSASTETTCNIFLISQFIRSTRAVFETMLESGCSFGEIEPVQSGHHMSTVTAVIGMSGELSGALSISTPAPFALDVLRRMTGHPAEEIDEFVRDVVGELANMIAGKGKRELSHYGLKLGLPQVIVGEDYTFYSPRWTQHYWLFLESDFGCCSLDVGFDTLDVLKFSGQDDG